MSELDPELAELMRLEEEERQAMTAGGSSLGSDAELRQLEELLAQEGQSMASGSPGQYDDELAELERLEEEERNQGH